MNLAEMPTERSETARFRVFMRKVADSLPKILEALKIDSVKPRFFPKSLCGNKNSNEKIFAQARAYKKKKYKNEKENKIKRTKTILFKAK